MSKPELRQFVEEVMNIRPGMAGLGSASAGIIGTTGTEGAANEKLHTDVLAFASALQQASPDRDRLTELARELEGSLLTVKMVSGMSDDKLERLISTLHELIA